MDDEETLNTLEVILGIQLVNDFEINPFQSCEQDYGYEKKQGPSIRGLFALASMPSHNCIANSTHEFSSRYLFVKLVYLILHFFAIILDL